MDYLRAWLRNLVIDLSVLAVVCIGMLIFMKIFYPDALSVMFLSGQFAIGMVNVLKLWPLVILAVIVYAMPRRRTRR
jgi:hypothetical protein